MQHSMQEFPTVLIEQLADQLKHFLATMAHDLDRDLTRRHRPDKWSAHEHLAHLGRYHEIFLERIGRILRENNPGLPRYRAEEDAAWDSWCRLSTRSVLDKMELLRTQLVSQLGKLSDREFERTGTHSRFGSLTLKQWLQFFLVHEGHHLYLVFEQARS